MEGIDAAGMQDWEMLHSSDSDEPTRTLDGAEDDSHGAIRSDYFSLHSNYDRTDATEEGSVESDGPSWVDPDPPKAGYQRTSPGGADFWTDSGSDRSETQRSRDLNDFDGKPELGFAEDANRHVGSEGIDEIQAENRGSSFESDHHRQLGFVENVKSGVGFYGIDEFQTLVMDSGQVGCDSGGYGWLDVKSDGRQLEGEVNPDGYVETQEISGVLGENSGRDGLIMEVEKQNDGVNGCGEGQMSDVPQGAEIVEETEEEMKLNGVVEQRRVVWWKLPSEFIKFCIFRVSPVWSFSVAAAVMGFVILGRRLYKMKRKSQSMQLKVTVDDKKVSQFMSRAARLNEAFSVVRRAPILRPPSLPAAGITTWPVMSLR